MLKVRVQTNDDEYLLDVAGDVEYVSTALAGLNHCVAPQHINANGDGFLRVNGEAAVFLHAWLHAVEITHHAKIVWLPITDNALGHGRDRTAHYYRRQS